MRRGLLMIVIAIVAAGCSRDDAADSVSSTVESVSTSSAPTSTEAPTTSSTSTTIAPTTTAAPATTEAPATTAPPETTSPPTTAPAEPWHLRADGIGSIDFGTPEAATRDALAAQLGASSSGLATTYATDLGDGTFIDDASGNAFAFPFGGVACFDNALCVYFGGAAADSMTFVGWVQSNEGVDPPLETSAGVTAGSTWADHPDALEVPDAGCFSYTYGSTDGMIAELFSNGEPFSDFDEAGNPIDTDPDPADVIVINLSAGAQPYYYGDDC